MKIKVKAVVSGTSRPMKDSGVEWIGAIPKSWSVVRTKHCYMHHKEIVGDKASEYERLALTLGGVIKRSKGDVEGLQPESFSGYQILHQNELVFKLIDLENISTSRVGYSPFEGIVSPAYIVLKPRVNEESLFGELYFLSMWQRCIFNQLGDDGVRSSLNASDLLNIPYLQVPSDEKEIIVRYLRAECARIDSVIEKTRESIEEYKKLKQSIITEAVTKGICPNRNLKPSGNIWFDSIPFDWKMKRIKYLFTIQKRIAGEEGYTVLSITQKGIVPKDLSTNEGQLAETYKNYQLVHIGDYAMNHMDLLTGWVDISRYEGVTSPDYRVFTLKQGEACDSQYYLYVMQMCYMNHVFYGLGQGVSGMGRWRLQTDKFLNFTVPVPPINEQKEIVGFLNRKSQQIDSIIQKKEQYITELESLKKSLVYEYVTGKRKVV